MYDSYTAIPVRHPRGWRLHYVLFAAVGAVTSCSDSRPALMSAELAYAAVPANHAPELIDTPHRVNPIKKPACVHAGFLVLTNPVCKTLGTPHSCGNTAVAAAFLQSTQTSKKSTLPSCRV
ncbi:hypothetical protein XFF6992_270093 [Xanthomonas citri pv. fuscans]|nr:hypothetical protein XFF6992_270093 [Xanthomonas citri pv. fuscans]SOO32854.1 hypothetical protein XFF6994_2400003 [Xanthomonas citri pv. fuscans]